MPVQQFFQDGMRVPYIAPWTPEVNDFRGLAFYGGAMRYLDETHIDRYHGVTWVRTGLARGRGRANLAGVHPLRQRRAMNHLACQVCGESTFDQQFRAWGERHLFIVAQEKPIAEGEQCPSPPVHVRCAIEAQQDCPHLRRGHAMSLVQHAPVWGIAGVLYDPLTRQPVRKASVPYTDTADLRRMVATREIISLHGCTTVTLAELMAAT
ncbi:hypothetical protein [[Kitasatospora] papulosa]|uniref:hypothetical protein n=1 Tax=[Kitasatospora] papulosa TaxID=1464011 RepID=UPI003675D009